jgi:ABC-type bacteriocin/lantibiotic exporter with double-glycine peptidase domain
MKYTREIWSLLDRRQRRALLGVLLLSILAAFSTVGGVAAVVPFLALVADPQQIGRNASLLWAQNLFGITRREDLLLLLGCAFFVAVLLSNSISLLSTAAAEKFSHSLAAELQLRLFDAYLRLDCGFHARTNSASLATNILQEVYRLTTGIIFSGLVLVSQATASALIVCFVVAVNPVVALSTSVALGGAYLFIFLVVRRPLASHGKNFTREWHERARLVNEALGAVKEILLMRNQAFFTGRFAEATRQIESAQVGIAAISRSPKFILECVTAACLVGAAVWLSRTPDSGNLLAQLSLLGIAAYRLLPALQQSFLNASKIRANRTAFERIEHDLRLEPLGVGQGHSPPDPAWRNRPQHAIALHGITFRYAADRQPALRRLSLNIEAGSFVALLGPNGSGKTTLVDVILGLLRPEEGRVEIDGITLDSTNLASWQSAAAYVPQSTFLLNASLAENIALGTARSNIDECRLRDAVKRANLEELVATLPRGLEEPLGERGAFLSGGQRQRVGIARALYRRPSLLVLDEATGALDTNAERALVDVLAELRGKCTIILIAHRFGSLGRCDRVFEMDHGAIYRSSGIAPNDAPQPGRATV